MHDLIPIGLVITLEPLPIVGFILTLSTDRGTRNGAAFIAAWYACLVAIIVATLTLTGGEPITPSTAPATAVLVLTLGLGLLLLAVATKRWARPPPEPPPAPSWVRRLDGLRPRGAAGLGVLLQPWPLVAAAAMSVSSADLASPLVVVELVAFSLVATSSLLIMQVYATRAPEASRDTLARLRAWIDRHRNKVITVLAAVVGTYLTAKGAYGLLT